jgi:hypothetical protein
MSIKLILEEDWREYNNRKMRTGNDSRNFTCSEFWEVDYLKNKIRKHYPSLTDQNILNAIEYCCVNTLPPHPRKEFIDCIAQKLNIPSS